MRDIHHLIDGRRVVGASGRTSPVFNPATGEQTGVLSQASAEEVDAAVASAQAAFAEWSAVSVARRTALMFAFRNLVVDNAAEIARRLTAEHGKVHADALGEVARAIDNIEFACGLAE
ncbi:MAG: aldehyde dehydrogenase family protein, partial [bacterium]|nr:aldehyde dehydrogenase family protein [bacterium]